MKFSDLVVDIQAQEEGQWFDHPRFRGVRVLVKHTRSKAYVRQQRALLDAFPLKRMKRSDVAVQTEYVHRYSLPWLVGGWTGIDDAEYSEDVAKSWVNDDDLYAKTFDFWEGLFELAEEVGKRQLDAQKVVLGN